jgi:hypothetical protein
MSHNVAFCPAFRILVFLKFANRERQPPLLTSITRRTKNALRSQVGHSATSRSDGKLFSIFSIAIALPGEKPKRAMT